MKRIFMGVAAIFVAAVGLCDDHLKALYRFDEGAGTVVADASGNGNDAVLVNHLQWISDGSITAVQLDKKQQSYLSCAKGSALNGTGNFTLSGWFNTTSRSTMTIFFQREALTEESDGLTGSYTLNIDSKGRLLFLQHDGKKAASVRTAKQVSDGTWHHVAVLRKDDTVKIYIDGVLEGEKADMGLSLNGNIPLTIGAQVTTLTRRYFFHGLLDDLAIRSEALSEEEISFLAAHHGQTVNSDADGDGLSNREELTQGLDPLNPDSDYDGVRDGDEIKDNTDPLVHNRISLRGWMYSPIGNVADGSTINYYEAGGDFQFHTAALNNRQSESLGFVYKTVKGNFAATAKVAVHEAGIKNSKAAFTVRNTLAEVTPFVSAAVSGKNGSVVNYRKKESANIKGVGSDIGKAPYWVRIVRKGSTVDCYISPNKMYWSRLCSVTDILLADEVKVGLSVNSGSLSSFSNVTFTDVTVEPLVDVDSDGLYDVEEQMISSNEALEDSDFDQLGDGVEVDEATSPVVEPTEIEGKIYHKQGLVTRYYPEKLMELKGIERRKVYKAFISESVSLGLGWHKVVDIGGSSVAAVTMQAMINIPKSGDYTFYTASDNGSMLYVDGKVVVDNDGIHHMQEKQGTTTLTAGLHKFELQYFQRSGKARLWTYWESSQLTKQPIPDACFVYAEEEFQQAVSEVDSDADGLTDEYELQIGSNPLKKDSDGDGLSDKAEADNGTDPNKADSDGDGIGDLAELKDFYTDPLKAEFDGSYTNVVSINGDAFDSSIGRWQKTVSNSAESKQRRGVLEYKFNLTAPDIYRVLVEFSGEGSISDYTAGVAVSVDGLLIAEKAVQFSKSDTTRQFYVMPYLPSGEHRLQLAWKNALGGRVASIKQIHIQTINGPDTDADGVKDWLEVTREKSTSVKAVPAQSHISPIYLEGTARYTDAVTVDGRRLISDSNRGINDEWFAYTDLAEGSNAVKLSFENGLVERTVSTDWVPLNLIEDQPLSEITVRKGSTILLTAAQADAQRTAAITVVINQNHYDLVFAPGQNGQSQPQAVGERAVVTGDQMSYRFAEAGTYSINATYAPQGGIPVSGRTLKVQVIDPAQPETVPAFLPDRRRVWTYKGLPEEAVVAVDDTVWLDRAGEELSITMTDAVRPRYATVRLKNAGPIVSTVKLQPVRFYGVGTTSMHSTPLDNGTILVEVFFVADPVMDDVSYEVDIYIPGVTFDDGKRGSRMLTKGHFNEIGETSVRFIKTPSAAKTATCHHLHVYQNGEYVGRDY